MKREFLSGFVTLIGSPNVGKSTLLNALIGQKVAIVSQRAQTTRNTIRGVLTRPQWQMVFVDTPGIHRPKNKLGEFMVATAFGALDEVECIVFVADPLKGILEQDETLLEKIEKAKAPVIAAINKCDAASQAQVEAVKMRLQQIPYIVSTCCISATTGYGLTQLEEELKKYLVAGPQYFPEDMVTDQPERVLCQEMIREKALLCLREEVPHGIGVDIEKMEVHERLTDVYATIYCEQTSHKGIIIGKGGKMLKRIGMEARRDMEWMLGTQVNLQLWVKVREDWRNRQGDLAMFGYKNE